MESNSDLFILREDVWFENQENKLIVFYGDQCIQFKYSEKTWGFIKNLQEGISLQEVHAEHHQFLNFFLKLKDRRLIKQKDIQAISRPMLLREINWLAYFQKIDPENFLAFLKSKKIAIIGAGGTGGIIAELLARSGIGKFLVIDGGVVDEPDLNRQWPYLLADVGKSKVEQLKTRLLSICPDLELSIHNEFIEGEEALEAIISKEMPHTIICCADMPIYAINLWCAQVALNLRIDVLFGGVGIEFGTIGPLLTQNSSKQNYISSCKNALEKYSAQQAIPKASISFTNSLLATQLAFEIFKHLTSFEKSILLEQSYKVNLINYELKRTKKYDTDEG